MYVRLRVVGEEIKVLEEGSVTVESAPLFHWKLRTFIATRPLLLLLYKPLALPYLGTTKGDARATRGHAITGAGSTGAELFFTI